MNKIKSASQILESRGANTPAVQEAIRLETLIIICAELIFDLRGRAGLTQRELAERVGTSQSAIARLEDADYTGHTLKMMHRIVHALGMDLKIDVVERQQKPA